MNWTPPADSNKPTENQSGTVEELTPLQQLQKVRDALNTAAISEIADLAALKKEVESSVKQLDRILKSLEQERHQIRWQGEKSVLDADLERERRKIEPIKPANPGGPHRIDW
jgi:parvulin-like peptidyl-prolyl isomerase